MTNIQKEFIDIKKAVIEKDFSYLNEMQLEAVTTAKGAVLILAGAGSGKTTVLVNRISNLVKYGDGYSTDYLPVVDEALLNEARAVLNGTSDNYRIFSHDAVKPWEILAITFTNKAAGELKDRIRNILGDDADYVKAGTFHSICSRILRRDGEKLGYTSRYTIYDTDDQRKVMKKVLSDLDISEKQIHPKTVLNEISSAKDRLITPEEMLKDCGTDVRMRLIAKAYGAYQKELKSADAMDFDDLIVNTVRLFTDFPEVLENYQQRIKYIMVDEYQDTDHAQYLLVKLLAEKSGNICVVGDDDQSIYRFRGATIENILSFESQYPDAKVIRLEQNYRSTQNILDAANAVIANNIGRKTKSLWTSSGSGEKIEIISAEDETEEAKYVANQILSHVENGGKFTDCAVLYRTNAQSRSFENVFVRSGISYKIIGGLRFYDRKEIKDVTSYLNVINNPNDNVRLRRIINEPKRGIGDTTINHAQEIADSIGISLFEVLENCDNYPALSRASSKLKEFCSMINEIRAQLDTMSLHDIVNLMLDKSGYLQSLHMLPPDEKDRLENVQEFVNAVTQFELENEGATLSDYLEDISLISDIDSLDSDADYSVLMTLHSAKGLEFNTVFIVGFEEGIFPGTQTIYGGPEEMEEERRLAYVGITRAKRHLYLTHTYHRMLYGQTSYNEVSRFVKEIPEFLCNENVLYKKKYSGFSDYSRSFDHSSSFGKQTRPEFKPKSSQPIKPTISKTDFQPGDCVHHNTFGDGTVIKASAMGNDTMLEINFAAYGVKRLMANFAKLEKVL